MEEGAAVGRVLGTLDATPLQFWVALQPGAYLQLDDVVVTTRELPGSDKVTIAGVVTQVRARHEGASFDSDVFAIAEGMLPAQVQEAAEITTTRVEPEVYVPPTPGALVRRAAGEERDSALYFDQMQRRVPVGLGHQRDDDSSGGLCRGGVAPLRCCHAVELRLHRDEVAAGDGIIVGRSEIGAWSRV